MGRNRANVCLPWRLTLLALCFFGSACWLHSQSGAFLSPLEAPQAHSQAEFDAYLEVITASNLREAVREADKFAATFPKSELLGLAFEHQMLAYQRLNDFEGLLRAGEKSLRLEPKNVNTLLTLASAIPNAAGERPDGSALLGKAQSYASLALQELGTMHIPRQISMGQWKIMQGEMEAQAHEALGHIAVKQGNLELAITEFERAAFENPVAKGSQFLRLGIAYDMAGRTSRAEGALRRALDLGPDQVRERALAELRKLRTNRVIK
jgi:tetratricopeptide (TPR) repeat protein